MAKTTASNPPATEHQKGQHQELSSEYFRLKLAEIEARWALDGVFNLLPTNPRHVTIANGEPAHDFPAVYCDLDLMGEEYEACAREIGAGLPYSLDSATDLSKVCGDVLQWLHTVADWEEQLPFNRFLSDEYRSFCSPYTSGPLIRALWKAAKQFGVSNSPSLPATDATPCGAMAWVNSLQQACESALEFAHQDLAKDAGVGDTGSDGQSQSTAPLEADSAESGTDSTTEFQASTREDFRPSADFRSFRWGSQLFSFSRNQAAVVKILWEQLLQKTPEVGDHYLLAEAEISSSRLDTVFRDHPAWGTMIVRGEGSGTRRLRAPASEIS